MISKLLTLAILFFEISAAAQVQSGFFGFNWGARDVKSGQLPHNNPWPTAIGSSFGRTRNWGTPTGWQVSETGRCSSPCDPSQSVFDWSNLDSFMNDVLGTNSSAKVEITTGAGDVPSWANGTSSNPKPNATDLPIDVADTTTTCSNIPSTLRTGAALFNGDCRWQEFVYALAEHECPTCNPTGNPPVYQGTLKFRSLSSGNEVNTTNYLSPNPCNSSNTSVCDDLIKMQADACKILRWVDSTITGCATPSFTDAGDAADAGTYLSRSPSLIGGGKAGDYADVLVGHIYGDPNFDHAGQPEVAANCPLCRSWHTKISNFTALMTTANHMNGKKFRIDEGGWGVNFETNTGSQQCSQDTNCGCSTSPIHACMNADGLVNQTVKGSSDSFTETNAPAPGYVVRAYLEALSNGAESFFWYNPGSDQWGSFADCPSSCITDITSANFTASAYAYLSLYNWAVGSTFDSSGIQNPSGTQYTYAITAKSTSDKMGCSSTTAASTYKATIAWDLTNAGSTLSCGSFTQYCKVFAGTAQPFSKDSAHTCSGTVTLGPNPILLEHN